MPLLALAASLLTTVAAYADLGDQLFKLLPDDGARNDGFGRSVAFSGTTAIIAAPWDGDNGNNSGSAYLFDISDPANPAQTSKLLPEDGEAQDFFAWSVAISGDIAIVGSVWDDDNGIDSGSAYLFDTATGQQVAKLLADDGQTHDQFGWSVAISGATAIVGALLDNPNGADSGSAYLFDTTTGLQLFKLLPDDGAAEDVFGISVAISGTTAIVGAVFDDDNGTDSGSAYLFDTTTGLQIAKLLPDDGAADDWFGWSVAISGTIAIVGAVEDDNENGERSGSAYLFDTTTGEQIAKLLANDGDAFDYFGVSVAISGTPGTEVAIVGADRHIVSGSGSAYLFDISDPKNPVQSVKLLSKDGADFDDFGVSVAISGNTALVGAFADDDNGNNSGSAYLFDAAATGNCPWDINGDGVVDHHDLVEVVRNLGICDDPDNCPWDVNGDGIVNGSDVAAVATHFGPCS